MISNIRNFSKTIWAKVILGIIVVPFVFWGMGDVFRGGNQNILAKIDKDKISTQDFIDYKNKQIRKQILLNESFNKHKLK